MTILIDESGKAVCSCPYCDGRLKVMNLEEVKSKWNSLKNKEAELEKELEANRKEQMKVFGEFVDEGFYWDGCKWVDGSGDSFESYLQGTITQYTRYEKEDLELGKEDAAHRANTIVHIYKNVLEKYRDYKK